MNTVLIGADNEVKNTIFTLLNEQERFRVVQLSYEKPVPGTAIAHLEIADLIILDLTTAKASTRFLISEIGEIFPNARIVALHIYKEMALVKPIMDAGAAAYLPVDTSRKELLESISAICNGEQYISKAVQ